jgi:hypothetical protein
MGTKDTKKGVRPCQQTTDSHYADAAAKRAERKAAALKKRAERKAARKTRMVATALLSKLLGAWNDGKLCASMVDLLDGVDEAIKDLVARMLDEKIGYAMSNMEENELLSYKNTLCFCATDRDAHFVGDSCDSCRINGGDEAITVSEDLQLMRASVLTQLGCKIARDWYSVDDA